MAVAIGLRPDYEACDLRSFAKASRDARQTRRLLALAVIYEGGARTEAARIGGVTLQIVRDGCCGSTRKARRADRPQGARARRRR